jgi:hypothetical protein
VEERRLRDLSGDIKLKPGELRNGFYGAEDLAAKLLELSKARVCARRDLFWKDCEWVSLQRLFLGFHLENNGLFCNAAFCGIA